MESLMMKLRHMSLVLIGALCRWHPQELQLKLAS